MSVKMNDEMFVKALASALANLENNKQAVNDLNVFPVPDGDTGTNMSLTIQYALRECRASDSPGLSGRVSAAANGALMGARGNSGVILSQLFRGFSKSLKGKDTASVADIAEAMGAASEMAYKAVMKPTEGTILTVARLMSAFAGRNADRFSEIPEFLSAVIRAGYEALEQTPRMLPVLAEAGVVDAGGQGLLYILDGALAAFEGTGVSLGEETDGSDNTYPEIRGEVQYAFEIETQITPAFPGNHEKLLFESFVRLGGSVFVMQGDEHIAVSMRTDEPWTVMKIASSVGALSRIRITNLSDPREASKAGEETYCVMAVCSGEGFESILKDLGATRVISGGQTMNTSTGDFLDVIESVPARHYIILPNNKNIVLAARQAAEISRKDVTVVATSNIPEAVSALMEFDAQKDPAANEEMMTSAAKRTRTAQVTLAVRDSVSGGLKIAAGDAIGIVGSDIAVCSSGVAAAALESARRVAGDGCELITLYHGQDVSASEAEALASAVRNEFPDCDVQLFYGGQPLYHYVISAE